MADTAYPLIELENNIEDARGWLRSAIDVIEDVGDEEPEEAEAYLEAVFKATPGLRELLARLKAMEAELKDPFTPEMKEQLKRQREHYDDEADRWEAQTYG